MSGVKAPTYDSEVLIKQPNVDGKQIRESDGHTAAQTCVWISRVWYVQHWQKQTERKKESRFNKNDLRDTTQRHIL